MRTSTHLEKILALVDSSHESEALSALRKARRILLQDGLTFGDLARAALSSRPRLNLPFSIFGNAPISMDIELRELRQQIADLQEDLRSHSSQTEHWKRRAAELEQNLNASTAQSTRWRDLARETVEKLWDLGREMNVGEFAAETPSAGEQSPSKTA